MKAKKGQENDVSIHKAVYSNYARDLVIKRPAADVTVFLSTTKERRKKEMNQQHLICLDSVYNSKSTRQRIIKRCYIPHIPNIKERGQAKERRDIPKAIIL
jgi:hypothetical protein